MWPSMLARCLPAASLTETRGHPVLADSNTVPIPGPPPAWVVRGRRPVAAAAGGWSAADARATLAPRECPRKAERSQRQQREGIEVTAAATTARRGSRLHRQAGGLLRRAVSISAREGVVVRAGRSGSDGERSARLLRATPASRGGTA